VWVCGCVGVRWGGGAGVMMLGDAMIPFISVGLDVQNEISVLIPPKKPF